MIHINNNNEITNNKIGYSYTNTTPIVVIIIFLEPSSILLDTKNNQELEFKFKKEGT